MAAPRELSLEAICNFISENGGRVTNHDLVKHFKPFLTDPESRVEARNKFKEYVNQCAVLRNEEGEKYLVLKKKFRNGGYMDSAPNSPASPGSYSSELSSPTTPSHDPYTSVGYSDMDQRMSPSRQPPPYRSPPPVMQSPSSPGIPSPPNLYHQVVPEFSSVSPNYMEKKLDDETDYNAPPVPPRRKSSDKLKIENKENVPDTMKRPRTLGAENGKTEGGNSEAESDRKISVKEQMQKFNRLATESELAAASRVFPGGLKKRADRTQQGADDDDTASVTSLDAKSREWLVCSSQADYQLLAKLVKENNKLAKLRDPTNYTALHWAAKHGEENVVKLIAGSHRGDVNARTNGGYTPLHIAMMYGHENIFNLLVTVYGADQNIRDWSGRKPRQYLTGQDTSVSADTFRKIKARKKHAEKDLGFLRIGSLNVRVKRTTEAVSNFLGVGNSQNNQKIHKSWGSADNIKDVNSRQLMPPPQFPVKKRKSKRAQDFTSRSTPTTPPVKNRTSASSAGDSDSDTACGFDSNWQSTV